MTRRSFFSALLALPVAIKALLRGHPAPYDPAALRAMPLTWAGNRPPLDWTRRVHTDENGFTWWETFYHGRWRKSFWCGPTIDYSGEEMKTARMVVDLLVKRDWADIPNATVEF